MDTRMDTTTQTSHYVRRTCEALGVAAGAWLIAAPMEFAMNFTASEVATFSTIAVGIVAVLACLVALLERAGSIVALGVLALAGIWAIIAPYVLEWEGGAAADSALNSIWMGIALVLLAIVGYGASQSELTER